MNHLRTCCSALFLLLLAAGCSPSGDSVQAAPTTDGEPISAMAASADGEAADSGTAEPSTPAAKPHPARARLVEAIDTYEEIEANGGWPTIPDGEVVEQGESAERVAVVRQRLRITGDLDDGGPATARDIDKAKKKAEKQAAKAQKAGEAAPTDPETVMDEQLAKAIERFQARHGLAVDGVLGPNTVATMNVPVAERIAQLQSNLDKWDDLPADPGERYIIVNIPEFVVRGYENDKEALQMKVIVGKEMGGRETPRFNDVMEHVVFRPYWFLPHSIASNEVVPAARKNPGYLSSKNYEIVRDFDPTAKVLANTAGNVNKVAEGDLRLRQAPGGGNALGLVKFIFPNQKNIYLHDTPADHLFAEEERDFSHGCIRLEKPDEFAAWVLGPQGWDLAKAQQAMQSGENHHVVKLDKNIPVWLRYMTAYVDDDGSVQFRKDIYGIM